MQAGQPRTFSHMLAHQKETEIMSIRSLVSGAAALAVLAASALGHLPAHAAPAPVGDADTCQQGYVWREAFTGDHVCVTPDVRAQAAYDNAHAAERIDPVNHAYGPDTCIQGFVWRDARPGDHVCVTPAVRAQAAADNAQAANRLASHAAPVAAPQPALALGLVGKYADQFEFYVRNDGTANADRITISGDKGYTNILNDWGPAVGEVHSYAFTGGAPRERFTILVHWENGLGQTSDAILRFQLSNFGYL
jgi:hypothetical protein